MSWLLVVERRNEMVLELKCTQFPRACESMFPTMPTSQAVGIDYYQVIMLILHPSLSAQHLFETAGSALVSQRAIHRTPTNVTHAAPPVDNTPHCARTCSLL
uniref:Uncharacterized protein n=1 Tax=Anguilla anguilla TaxID=7936 RepID=A0A0E9X326_ANGAN